MQTNMEKASNTDKEQPPTNGEPVGLYTEKPTLNEVEWDQTDRTCAKLSWSGTNLSSEQEKYRIHWGTDETDRREDETAGTEYYVSKLKKGCTYFAYVLQVNSAGNSEQSNIIRFDTEPNPPTDMKVTPSSDLCGFIVEFKDNSSFPTKYEVIAKPLNDNLQGKKVNTNQHQAVVANLMAGECYSISVIAMSKVDDVKSEPATIEGYVKTIPGKIKNLRANFDEQNEVIVFEWDALEAEPDEYRVQWRVGDEAFIDDSTLEAKFEIGFVKPAQRYSARVCAVNKSGCGKSSQWKTCMTGPLTPCNIVVSNYEHSPQDHLLVKFENTNATHVKHFVRVQSITGEEPNEREVEDGQNFALISGLEPGQSYSINVFSVNEGLRSALASYPKMVYTYPDVPKNVKVERTLDALKLEWDHLNIKPKSYKIFWEENGKKDFAESSENDFFINNPSSSMIYKFKVAAVNDAGQGEKSKEAVITTAPAAPTNISVIPNPRAKTRSFIVKYEDPDPFLKKRYRIVANRTDGEHKATIESDDQIAVLNDLSPGQSYYIYVVALYGNLESPKAHYYKNKK